MTDFGSSEAGKKGGAARAEKLTKEQRQDIARQAAAARWGVKVKQATHRGFLNIGAVKIPCYVLEDGTRVISGRSMTAAIGMKGRGQGIQRILTHRVLKSVLDDDLKLAIQNPLLMEDAVEKMPSPHCYEATVLVDLCDAIQRAGEDGLLKTVQERRYAKECGILIRSVAKVGIIALVDEATGYQRDRARDELAKILEAFVAKEIQKWVRTFDLEFYELICEVRGLPLEKAKKRPKYFGHLTNNLVYCRLAPGVLDELKRVNPADERGIRKARLHQGLTPDIGHPKLKEHLAGVTTALKMAKIQKTGWDPFISLLDKTHPKFKPMPLFDHLEDEPE